MRVTGASLSTMVVALLWAMPAAAVPPGFKAKADALLAEGFAADAPGVAVIVMDDGKVAYSAARGLADIDTKRQITPDTVFRLGSITKQFTAAVILQLAESGKLSLSDPISKFLPEFPKPAGDVTVRQLLSHTSGLQTFTPGTSKANELTATESLVAEIRGKPMQAAAGAQYSYNNGGYVLLGAIIEKVTGRAWYQAVEEHITRPLALTAIRYGVEEANVPAMARGYARMGGKIVPSQPFHMSFVHAAGALTGTVGDLAKWAKALHGGKVVKSETYRQMIARTRLTSGEQVAYAMGLENGEVRGRPTIGHGGRINGFAAESLYVPKEDLFVAVIANILPGGNTSTDSTALRLAGLALNDPYPSFTRAEVAMAQLEPLLGLYTWKGGVWLLSTRDGKMLLSRNLGGDVELSPAGGDRFFLPGTLEWLSIARDGAGKHVMTIHPGGTEKGETLVWSGRLPSAPPPANAPRAVEASASQGSAQSQVSGIWFGEVRNPENNSVVRSMLELKAEGETLTGAQIAGGTAPVPIKDGSVSGSKFTFLTSRGTSQNGIVTMKNIGEVKGDELTLAREVVGAAPSGGTPPPLVLKRVAR